MYAVILKGEEGRCYVKKKKKRGWDWQPRDEGARIECKKNVVNPKEGFSKLLSGDNPEEN